MSSLILRALASISCVLDRHDSAVRRLLSGLFWGVAPFPPALALIRQARLQQQLEAVKDDADSHAEQLRERPVGFGYGLQGEDQGAGQAG